MPETLQTVMFALAVIVPLEYTFVALSSLVSKVVVANFIRDLGETSRSRETKSECQAMEKKIVSRYRQSLLWPVEVWKGFQRKK